MPISPTYTKIFTIPQTAIDENGHVNNVAYVQWMHAESVLPSSITHPSVGSRRRAHRHQANKVIKHHSIDGHFEFEDQRQKIPKLRRDTHWVSFDVFA